MPLPTSKIEGDFLIMGEMRVTGQTVIDNPSITNAMVAAGADFAVKKLQHQHRITYCQESGTNIVDEAMPVHVVKGKTAKLLAIKAGCVVLPDDTSVVIDLLKNGVTVLTGTISVNPGHSPYELVAGAFSSTGLEVGDVLEVDINESASSGKEGKGVFVYVDLEENYD